MLEAWLLNNAKLDLYEEVQLCLSSQTPARRFCHLRNRFPEYPDHKYLEP